MTGKPWDAWPTLGFGLLITVLWMVAQTVTALILAARGVSLEVIHI